MVATMLLAAYYGSAAAATLALGGTMAYAATVFAVNFAVSMIVTKVFADNPEAQQDMGVRQQVPPSAVNAIPVVYGDAYMGGTFVDAVLSTDQKTMYYVLAVSGISTVGQFTFDTTKIYYGDRLVTFDGSDLTKVVSLTDEAGNVDTKISGNLYINLYKSNAAGTITALNGASAPSTVMGGSDIAVGQRWTGTRQMNGLGFAIVKLTYNRDADTTALSPITFHVAHYLNGAGVAKPGDVWYDYMTNTVYGGAVDTAFVDSACVAVLNTYADATITFTNSSGSPDTQARYRINGVLDAGQTVLSNVDRIMSACDSWMTYNAALGQWSVVVNKAESTAWAFTDNNIIGDIRVSVTDLTSSINQVEARFPNKTNRDQAAFVNIETPSGLLYPNEPVNKYSLTYDLVNDSVQTQYLANRLLEQAREDLIVSFSTTYYGIQVNAGDVVSVTNTDYGWSAKLFRVMKVNEASLPDGGLGAKLELSEYNAAVFDDASITQFTPVPNSGLPSVSYFSPLSATTVTGYPTATIPHFDVSVSIPATGRVTTVSLFYTTSATPTATDWKLLQTAETTNAQPITNSTSYVFANQSLPAATYYFGYIVGNEISQSVLSALSSSFVWSPTGLVGTNGTRTAILVVYKWSATQPVSSFPVGTSDYTWATGLFTAPATLNGWSIAPPAAVVGQTLWACRTIYTDTLTATVSTVTWSASASYAAGAAGTNGTNGTDGTDGTNGASARVMYARIASNPTPVTGTVTVAGDNRPTGTQASAVWGSSFNVTWYANDPTPSSNDSLYQADGIYDGTNTAWSTPYISALKVGALSAVSTNTGSLTISGTLQSNTAAISGTTMTGAGGVLYSTGNFAFGNATTNISYNGTQMTLNGNVVATANVNSNAITTTAYTQVATNVVQSAVGIYNLLTATTNTGGQPILCIFGFLLSNTGGVNGFNVSIKIDGTIIKTYSYPGGGSGSTIGITGVAYVATPSSGNFDVEMNLQILPPASANTITIWAVGSTGAYAQGTYFYLLGTKR